MNKNTEGSKKCHAVKVCQTEFLCLHTTCCLPAVLGDSSHYPGSVSTWQQPITKLISNFGLWYLQLRKNQHFDVDSSKLIPFQQDDFPDCLEAQLKDFLTSFAVFYSLKVSQCHSVEIATGITLKLSKFVSV
jgi:hypothetical protein